MRADDGSWVPQGKISMSGDSGKGQNVAVSDGVIVVATETARPEEVAIVYEDT